jgi:signal transduction histidine kinase
LILQAITHLLNHVAKHSQHTSPIAVRISRSDEARLRITIEDHGATSKALELATDFVSTSGPRPRRQGYLNRALEPYLSKVIVEAHDGRIWADRTAAGSARWNLTFPLADGLPVTARYTPTTPVGA